MRPPLQKKVEIVEEQPTGMRFVRLDVLQGQEKVQFGQGGDCFPWDKTFPNSLGVHADRPFSSWHLSNCFTVGIPEAMAKALSPKSLKLNLKGSGKSVSSRSSMSFSLGKRPQKGAVANFWSLMYLSLNAVVSESLPSP